MHSEAVAEAKAEGKFGVWLFLLTEVLLFGGLFILYTIYRMVNAEAFRVASQELDRAIGTANTAVLITSSLFVALAGYALHRGMRRRSELALAAAMLLGLTFLCVKAFEWSAKFHHGLYPGSQILAARGPAQTLFFGLYFGMTGLHALHVIAGLAVLSGALFLARRKSPERGGVLLDNVGLYWHLVDIIWVFLFPLFYLID